MVILRGFFIFILNIANRLMTSINEAKRLNRFKASELPDILSSMKRRRSVNPFFTYLIDYRFSSNHRLSNDKTSTCNVYRLKEI